MAPIRDGFPAFGIFPCSVLGLLASIPSQPPLAVEHIRRNARRRFQAHLMRCDDGGWYVVKFQNNPQHVRVLANEMLASRMAARMGLPVARVEVVEVREDLIALTAELVVQLGSRTGALPGGTAVRLAIPGRPGSAGGARFPAGRCAARGGEPDGFLLAMLVFDKWTCNTNGRQAVFFAEPGRSRRQAMMIDQGFCFNAGERDFSTMPRCAESICGIASTSTSPEWIHLNPGLAASSSA